MQTPVMIYNIGPTHRSVLTKVHPLLLLFHTSFLPLASYLYLSIISEHPIFSSFSSQPFPFYFLSRLSPTFCLPSRRNYATMLISCAVFLSLSLLFLCYLLSISFVHFHTLSIPYFSFLLLYPTVSSLSAFQLTLRL